MNIVVCVKQVPDTWSEKKLDRVGQRRWTAAPTDPVMNEMDEYAVEEALKLEGGARRRGDRPHAWVRTRPPRRSARRCRWAPTRRST